MDLFKEIGQAIRPSKIKKEIMRKYITIKETDEFFRLVDILGIESDEAAIDFILEKPLEKSYILDCKDSLEIKIVDAMGDLFTKSSACLFCIGSHDPEIIQLFSTLEIEKIKNKTFKKVEFKDLKAVIHGLVKCFDGYEDGNYLDLDEEQEKNIIIDFCFDHDGIEYHIEGSKELIRTYYRSETRDNPSEEEWRWEAVIDNVTQYGADGDGEIIAKDLEFKGELK